MSNKSSLKSNVIANFSGQIWITVIGILVVPIYLRYLGVELYGVIGVFWTLQNLLTFLDIGLAQTLNREIAHLSALPEKSQEMRDLTRTLELPHWLLSILLGLLTFLLSPVVAEYWVNSATIPIETITYSFRLMSIAFAFQWASSIYLGGFLGLQKQVTYNVINVFCQTVRSVGSVVVLVFFSPTIQAFLLWQAVWTGITTLIFAVALWRIMPASSVVSKFRFDLLRGIWRFAAGMTGNNIAWLILNQLDKVILSKLLTLEMFGYYSLANLLTSTGLMTICISISRAYYPQFSQLAALGEKENLTKLYHNSCQVMSFLLIPVSIVLAFFSYPILLLWTQHPDVAQNTYLLLSLQAIGYGLYGLTFLPTYIQWADGLTRVSFWQNVGAIILLVPFMVFATLNYGAIGGPISWLIMNVLFVCIGMPIMHRFVLRGELKKWYLEDVGFPALSITLAVGVWWYFYPADLSPFLNFIFLFSVSAFAMMVSLLTTPFPRSWVLRFVSTKYRQLFPENVGENN